MFPGLDLQCPACPRSQIGDAHTMGGCHAILMKASSWTIVDNIFGECKAPYMSKRHRKRKGV
jgi:hypothetical protein